MGKKSYNLKDKIHTNLLGKKLTFYDSEWFYENFYFKEDVSELIKKRYFFIQNFICLLISSVKFGELNTDAEGRCDYKNQKANTVIQLQELNENGKLVDFRPQGLSLEHKQ